MSLKDSRVLSDIMTTSVVTVAGGCTVKAAATLMSGKNIGSVLVIDSERLGGILTERDLLRFFASGKDAQKIRVSEIMTREVIYADPKTPLSEAAKILKDHGFRRLPVIKDGKILGIATGSDLMYGLNSPKVTAKVEDYMCQNTYTLPPEKTVSDAAKFMVKSNVGSVIAVREGEIAGIITERDLLHQVLTGRRNPYTRIEELMTSEIISVEPQMAISYLVPLISYYMCRHFPVLGKENKLVGLISERDILFALYEYWCTATVD